MRRILRDMLTRVGIKRVFEAPDGAEALGVLGEFEARPRHHRLGPRDPLGRGVHPPHPDAEDLAGPDGADHPDAVEAAALRRRPGGGARRQRGHRQAVLAEDPVVAPRRGAQPPARLRRGERALAPGAPRRGGGREGRGLTRSFAFVGLAAAPSRCTLRPNSRPGLLPRWRLGIRPCRSRTKWLPSRIRRGTSPRRARMAICPRRRRSGTTAGRPGRTRITAGPRRRTAIPTRRSISAPTIAACWSPSPPITASASSTPSRASSGSARAWASRNRLRRGGDGAHHRGAARLPRARWQRRESTRARLVATEACRLADNGADVHRPRVADELGLELEIVDRATEAYLAVTGCAALADPQRAFGRRLRHRRRLDRDRLARRHRRRARSPTRCKRIRAWDSLPVGVVTLAERHGGVDVTPDGVRGHGRGGDAISCADSRSSPARRRSRAEFHLLGTSGTVTTVGGIHLGLPRYDRRRVDGMWMRDGEVTAVHRRPARHAVRPARRRTPASAASAPTWCSPAAPSSRRSGGRSPPTACASPTAACAKAS